MKITVEMTPEEKTEFLENFSRFDLSRPTVQGEIALYLIHGKCAEEILRSDSEYYNFRKPGYKLQFTNEILKELAAGLQEAIN